MKDPLFERGIDSCHETVRPWWNRFGPLFAGHIRRQLVSRRRGFRHWSWHLDEIEGKSNSKMVYSWPAIDQDGEVLHGYVTRTRHEAAALRFMREALWRHASLHDRFSLERHLAGRRSYKQCQAAARAVQGLVAS